ncbi:Nicotinate dehydrogenase subunit B [Luteitalea pratensis]|uniref:Nicotinate dehydrogenase subunit B n=1 Tax=Luteitalea pratensis TaxID=1855912 RepID=A0A143PKF7_LUTPR|nr:xanthine dehydrogenase family protein [Luteitalea pratensis]AMY08971.1 Nicotinate dehydrogenase subunit B [Luteitalea pratensis]
MAEDLRAAYKRRFDEDLEPETYTVVDALGDLTPDRRAFLKALGGGMLLLVTVRAQGVDVPVRVQVSDDGTYRAFTGKMDMGQGSRTLLTQAFAEELGVPLDRVVLVMGDTRLCPDDGGTWASITTPVTVPVIRKAAAAVRAVRAATPDGLVAPAAWRTLGQSVPNVTGLAIVTGAKAYPSDRRVPGLRQAAVVRSPNHKATLKTFDASAAERLPGVRVLRDGDLLATVAGDMATARRAAALVTAEWTPESLTPQGDWVALFRKTAVEPVEQPRARYPPLLRRGDVVAGLAGAVARQSSVYQVAPIAHVPLEPRAAIAEWNDDGVTVHSGVQAPFLCRQEVAKALDVPETRVRIVAADSGGAYGGKQRGECEVEAARLSRLAGAPVRVAWTREEEFTCSYARPAGLLDVESGVDAGGRLVAMRFANYNSGAAGLAPQYDIAHHWVGFYRTQSDVRQGSYRSLAAVANNFALESHMDEWAATLGLDPVAFRLRNITDARLREVIERSAARFGWKADAAARKSAPTRERTGSRRGVGMSCNLEKDARLALFVEVEVSGTDVRVVRMVATGDFGAALNPDALQNQMTGAIIQGLGGALWEQVTYDGTTQRTRRLSEYRVPRFRDLPDLDVQLIDRRDIEPAGAGESPITLTAPALAAAIFDATGERRRSLPLVAAR